MLYRPVTGRGQWEYLIGLANQDAVFEARSLNGVVHLLSDNGFPYATADENQRSAVRFTIATEVANHLLVDAVRTVIVAGEHELFDMGKVYPWEEPVEQQTIETMVWKEKVVLDIATDRRFLRSLIQSDWMTLFERSDVFTLRELPKVAKCSRCRFLVNGFCEARGIEEPYVSNCVDYSEWVAAPKDRYVRVEPNMIVLDDVQEVSWVERMGEKIHKI